MSAVSFRSVFMVASCAGAALGCYLVSLRVASERAALEEVETKIVLAQRDIRVLQTEIGTRGRLAQLERWNVKVMALSAPTADQFLKGGFELARFTAPERKAPIDAPVVLASAPAEADAGPVAQPQAPQRTQRSPLMYEASLKAAPRQAAEVSLAPRARQVSAEPTKSSAKAVQPKSAEKATPRAASVKSPAAPKMAPAKTASSAAAKPSASAKPTAPAKVKSPPSPTKTAKATARDPLAPMPGARTSVSTAAKTSKDSAKKQ